jgi:hypothetical protein
VERVARYDARLASLEAPTEQPEPPQPEPGELGELDDQADGVHAIGGGWHEIVVDGAVVDKLRGAEAAEEAYQNLTESDDGD